METTVPQVLKPKGGMCMEKLFIGGDSLGKNAVGTIETEKQIKRLKLCNCVLRSQTTDQSINHTELSTLFQAILSDRKLRMDEGKRIDCRPPFAVATIDEGRIVRLEYYAGTDYHELQYDLRATGLANKPMKCFLDEVESDNPLTPYSLRTKPPVLPEIRVTQRFYTEQIAGVCTCVRIGEPFNREMMFAGTPAQIAVLITKKLGLSVNWRRIADILIPQFNSYLIQS